jgi:hypothetical protein
MKGAIADPPVKTTSMPNNIRIMMIGRSQNFFLTFRKPHNSFKNSISDN